MNLLPSFTKNFQTDSGQITAEITPIKTKDGDLLFFPKQLEQVLGYEDLAHSVKQSDGFIKDIDYIVIKNDKLKQIKELCNRSSLTASVNNQAKSAILLTESGFYAVLIKSKKPEAVNFRVWVTKEVLPAIRKTGKYEIPNSNFSVKQTFSDYLDIAKMCELTGNQAILAANKATRKLTGQNPIALLEVNLPSPVQEPLLTPTSLGNLINLTGRTINIKLEALGLQKSYRDAKGKLQWELTQTGKNYGAYLDTGKKHSDGTPVQQIKWYKRVLDLF